MIGRSGDTRSPQRGLSGCQRRSRPRQESGAGGAGFATTLEVKSPVWPSSLSLMTPASVISVQHDLFLILSDSAIRRTLLYSARRLTPPVIPRNQSVLPTSITSWLRSAAIDAVATKSHRAVRVVGRPTWTGDLVGPLQ